MCSLFREECVARNHRISMLHHVREATHPSRTVHALRRIGIAKKHRIIEIEQQLRGRTTQHAQLPRKQQSPLDDYGIRITDTMFDVQPGPPRARETSQLELMPSSIQKRTKRRQPIAATDVLR